MPGCGEALGTHQFEILASSESPDFTYSLSWAIMTVQLIVKMSDEGDQGAI